MALLRVTSAALTFALFTLCVAAYAQQLPDAGDGVGSAGLRAALARRAARAVVGDAAPAAAPTAPAAAAAPAVVVSTAALAMRGGCEASRACSLNGCTTAGGVCVCDAGWVGATCGVLDTLPVDPEQGMNGLPHNSSWGGSVVFAEGQYHLFFSLILGSCPMTDWQTNSACFHATAAAPEGPFTNRSEVYGAFCHNTIIREAWDAQGLLYQLWHIGDGDEGSNVHHCSGADAALSPLLRSDGRKPRADAAGNTFSTSRSIWGPWTRFPHNILNGGGADAWDASVSNMAPWPLVNGTVLLGYRGKNAAHVERLGIARADGWAGPYTPLTTAPIINATGEDPYLWVDARGNFHILFHAFAGMGGHAFATDLAGPWTLGDVVPYNSSIAWVNGTVTEVGDRERPELYLDPATRAPRVLYTGTLTPGGSGWGMSWTMAARVRA